MKRQLLLFAAALAIALLHGCASMGMTSPQSPEDQLRYGQAGVSAAYKTIGDQKAAGAITTEQGISMFRRVEAVEKELAAAEPLLKIPGSASTAAGKITLALQVLAIIQAELKSRQKTSLVEPNLFIHQYA